MSKINLARTAETDANFFTLRLKMIAEDNLPFFQEYEALINKYTSAPVVDGTSFKIGDTFRHRDSTCVPQFHGDQFAAWMAKPSADKVILIDFAGFNPLKEYVLPKNMKDTPIQTATGSTPMTETVFWLTLHALIIRPELGTQYLNYEVSKDKYYIFHVRLDDGTSVAVRLYWLGDGWYCNARRFDSVGAWNGGDVFLYSDTA